jgi:hypothetical protein
LHSCNDQDCIFAMIRRDSRPRRKTTNRFDIGSEDDTKHRRLPDFIVVGPPRTGTTWLDRVLRGHVELPADLKETQFFAWNFGLGINWYAAFFRNCDPLSLAGEIAPTYFDKPIVRHRIVRLLPHCKIICSLRDPVERVYSQYKTWHRSGLVRMPFNYDLLRQKLGANGSYAFNVRAWQKAYGTENVLVQLYEDLKRNDQSYIDVLCSFIGIPQIALARTKFGRHEINPSEESPRSLALARFGGRLRTWATRHPRLLLARQLEAQMPLWRFFFAGGPNYPPLDSTVDRNLRERLMPEIEELERLLGRDLADWKIPRRSTDHGHSARRNASVNTSQQDGRLKVDGIGVTLAMNK